MTARDEFTADSLGDMPEATIPPNADSTPVNAESGKAESQDFDIVKADPLEPMNQAIVNAFLEADDESARDRVLAQAAERYTVALRDLGVLPFTESLHSAITTHFVRYHENRLGRRRLDTRHATLRRRAQFIAATAVLLVLIVVYTYVFIVTSWSVVDILLGTVGILLSLGVIRLAWMAVEFFVIVITEPHEFAIVAAIVGAFSAGMAWLYWYIGQLPSRSNPENSEALRAIRSVVVGATVGPIAFIVLAAIALALYTLVSSFRRNPYLGIPVESFIVMSLSRALVLAMPDGAWVTFDGKNQVLTNLEQAAKAVEKGFPAALSTEGSFETDYLTDMWLTEQSRRIATSIRQLKRWILIPRADTRPTFQHMMGLFVTSAALGSWDGLRLADVDRSNEPGRLSKVLQVAREVVAGFAPLAIVLLLMQQQVLRGVVVTPILLFTGSLAFIVALRLIDPQVIERLGAARDLAGSLIPKKEP